MVAKHNKLMDSIDAAQKVYTEKEQERFSAEFEMTKLSNIEKNLMEVENEALKEQQISFNLQGVSGNL